MLVTICVLLSGLLLIVVGANFLIDGSVSLARRFKLSEFVVGLTIVGIGTSTPELVVSFIASLQGNADIAIGNVVGSNIANILFILGGVAIFSPITLSGKNIKRDVPLLVLVTLFLILLGKDTLYGGERDTLSRMDGVLLFIGFIAFITYSFMQKPTELQEESGTKTLNLWLTTLYIVLGLAGLIFGGELFVNSGSKLASYLGASDAFIGITIMAVGTSLPELAASYVAAYRKNSQMALGNIVGSNIFNILFILGGSAIISPLSMSGMGVVDLAIFMAAPVLIYISTFTFKKRMIDRWEGVIFVAIYIMYIGWLVSQI